VSDANIVAWATFVVEFLSALGGVIGTIAGLAALLMRRTFASKEELAKRFSVHDGEHLTLNQRLADGETRFATLSGSIEIVKVAAEQAKEAAHEARDAADNVNAASVEIAELKGSIKSIERLTLTMVEGHMDGSFQRRGANG
jgi:hypothetical protein